MADDKTDLALIQIKADRRHAAKLGDSDEMEVGDWVLAIGAPFGLEQTLSQGIVSAKGRSSIGNDLDYQDFIQTDAAINPGNSGGPLLDITGRMVGVNTAVYNEGMGIGFAIPAAVARRVVEDLVRYGQVQSVWIGLAVGEVREEGSPTGERPRGLPVLRLAEGGAAARAGVVEGDLVLSVGGVPADGHDQAVHFIHRVGRPGVTERHDATPLLARRGPHVLRWLQHADDLKRPSSDPDVLADGVDFAEEANFDITDAYANFVYDEMLALRAGQDHYEAGLWYAVVLFHWLPKLDRAGGLFSPERMVKVIQTELRQRRIQANRRR